MVEKLPKYAENGRQLIWDKSSIQEANCLRRYYYSKLKNLRRKDRGANFGIFAHNVFEHYDKFKHAEGRKVAVAETFKYALENGEAFVAPEYKKRFTLANLLRGVVWYDEQFENDPLKDVIEENIPIVERRFEVQLPTVVERLSGRIDKLVWYDGDIAILDRKFTESTVDSGYYMDQYSPDIQFYLYAWALRQLGIEVKHYIIEAHQMMATGYRCRRVPYTVPLDRLDDVVTNVLRVDEQIKRAFDEDYWPMNMTQCHIYGGCDYRVLCSNNNRAANILEEQIWQDSQNIPQPKQ